MRRARGSFLRIVCEEHRGGREPGRTCRKFSEASRRVG